MKNEQLYREAIKFAADAEERFLSAVEANKSFKDDRTLCEKHQQMEVIPAAQCAALRNCISLSSIFAPFGIFQTVQIVRAERTFCNFLPVSR